MFEFAKIYIRSLVGITGVAIIVCYGMYLGQFSENAQLAALAIIGACVLFDKPKIEEPMLDY